MKIYLVYLCKVVGISSLRDVLAGGRQPANPKAIPMMLTFGIPTHIKLAASIIKDDGFLEDGYNRHIRLPQKSHTYTKTLEYIMTTSTSIKDATTTSYERSGFSQKMGWGNRPALILIDVCKAYWSAGSPLDTSANPESVEAPASMRRLLAAARSAKAPVLWTKVYYDRQDMADAGLMYSKAKVLTVWQKGDTRGVEGSVDGLVDTLVICGVSTSGCVRATTLDAMQHGFRPMVSNTLQCYFQYI
jgi:hypothetical protein